MSTNRKRSLAPSLVGVALALAGCGGSAERPAVGPNDPTPTATLALTHPVISHPVGGSAVKAEAQENDVYTATVPVRGVAEPDTRVVVSTGCSGEGCRRPMRTAGDGSFEAEVDLSVEAEQPRGTIVVGYEDSGASVDSDRVIVSVEPPGVADEPRPRSTATPPASGARDLVVIGDSLAVGMRAHLQQFLSGWRITVDARGGRPLAEGMRAYDALPEPSKETVYAFSLFTNDGPTDVIALENAVKRSSAKGCAVWSTIVRPPVGGTTYAEVNRRLNALASARVRVVQWADRVARNPDWIAGDGVHGTPAGYRNRAALYAAAVKTCSG